MINKTMCINKNIHKAHLQVTRFKKQPLASGKPVGETDEWTWEIRLHRRLAITFTGALARGIEELAVALQHYDRWTAQRNATRSLQSPSRLRCWRPWCVVHRGGCVILGSGRWWGAGPKAGSCYGLTSIKMVQLSSMLNLRSVQLSLTFFL